ncbi:hypothetical protein [Sphingomonas sp.]|uniref:hypothetical protein n=1 Tax=Sphingomonas sp. TaxID=28214 RepID=UPI003B3A0E52
MKRALPLLLLLPLAACVSTVGHVVTAPVRVASWSVDKMTTSQKEADEKRGRRERKLDEQRAKEARKEAKRERKLAREQARQQAQQDDQR